MEVQQQGIEFFFDMIKWVFGTFLIKIKILEVPVLYYFIVIIIFSVIIAGVVNTAHSGYNSAMRFNRKQEAAREREERKREASGRKSK